MSRVYRPKTLHLAVLLSSLTGCSTDPDAVVPPPPGAQLQIVPAQVTLGAGTSFQFTASLTSGNVAAVTWSLEEATAGSITADGRFTHAYCFSGPVHIRAQLESDPTRSATAVAQAVYNEAAYASVQALFLADGRPATVDSVAGTARVDARVDARPYTCRELTSLRLDALSGATVLPIDSATFAPPRSASTLLSLTWHTTTVPNGAYQLRLTARRSDGSSTIEPGPSIQVRNP
jgi:hypothetical protein